MRRSSATFLLAGVLASSSAGCFMKRADGDRLVRESQAQATRLAALEQQVQELGTRQQEHHAALEQTVAELRTRVDEVRAQLEATGRGSADLGADLAMVRDTAARLDGRLAEIDQNIAATQAQLREQDAQFDRQIRQIATRLDIDLSLRESDIPADRTEHYSTAYRAFQNGDQARARALFGEYVRRYPQDENADNAQFWIAKSYQEQQQWQRAIGAYRELIRNFQQSDVLDQALFGMSQAFYELHDCTNARAALDALRQSRPQSAMMRDVERRQRELRTPPRGYCTN